MRETGTVVHTSKVFYFVFLFFFGFFFLVLCSLFCISFFGILCGLLNRCELALIFINCANGEISQFL